MWIVLLLALVSQSLFPGVAGATEFGTCDDVIAIPANTHDLTDASCSACNNGAYAYYPCDRLDLCYCNGTTIPPEYVRDYTYCDEAISVPGNPHSVTDTTCSNCALAGNVYYPCETVGLYCQCAPCHNTSTNLAGSCTLPPSTTNVPPTDPSSNPSPSSSFLSGSFSPASSSFSSSSSFLSSSAFSQPSSDRSSRSYTSSTLSSSSSGRASTAPPSPPSPQPTSPPTVTVEPTTSVPTTTSTPDAEASSISPTVEPPAPNGTKFPVIEVTMEFTINVEALRSNQTQLVTGLATATSVAEANIHIVSIEATEGDATTATGGDDSTEAGSTVVFDVETSQSQAEVTSSLKTSSSDSSSGLSFFGPIVDSITAKTKLGRLLFTLGFAFYFILILGGLTMFAAFGWAVYRRHNPEKKITKQPLVQIKGGRLAIGMASGAYQQDIDGDADADTETLVQNKLRDDEVPQCRSDGDGDFDQLSVMGPSRRTFKPRDVFHNTHGVAPHLVSSPSAQDIFGLPPQSPGEAENLDDGRLFIHVGSNNRTSREPPPMPCEMKEFRNEDEVELVVEQGENDGDSKIKIMQRASAKRSFERTLSKLQPSREVIDDDVAASYAMEGPTY